MKLLVEIIRSVRNIRAEVNTPLSKKIKIIISAHDEQYFTNIKNESVVH